MADMKSLNILVAEDDTLIGELLAEMLSQMGHEVCAITTTEAGTVTAARQSHPDLMIVDLRLSPGSGVDAVDLIMQTRFIPHILVSGSIARLRELRPHAVLLEKPYSQAALAAAILRTSAHA
jgi:CheY-like chemotaxis protein